MFSFKVKNSDILGHPTVFANTASVWYFCFFSFKRFFFIFHRRFKFSATKNSYNVKLNKLINIYKLIFRLVVEKQEQKANGKTKKEKLILSNCSLKIKVSINRYLFALVKSILTLNITELNPHMMSDSYFHWTKMTVFTIEKMYVVVFFNVGHIDEN